MEQEHRDRIQNNFNKLIEQISPQIEFVSSTLLQEHRIINRRMYENIIEENKGALKRTRILLETIFTRGKAAFSKLYETVLAAELYDAADTLMPENKPHWKIEPDGAEAQSSIGDLYSKEKENPKNQQNKKSETDLERETENTNQQNIHNLFEDDIQKEVTKSQDDIDRVPSHPGQHIKDAQRHNANMGQPILTTQALVKKPALPSEDSQASFRDESSLDEETYVKEIESSLYEQTYVKEIESSLEEQTYAKEIESSLYGQTYAKEIELSLDEHTNVKAVDSQETVMSNAQKHVKEPEQHPRILQLTFANVDKKLPEIWPSEEDLKDLKVALVEDNSYTAHLFREVHTKNNELVYSMKNKKRGNVLIIENVKFKYKHLKIREGSGCDRDSMKSLFENFGFNVVVHRNLTKEKMLGVMEEEGKKIETWHECFVIVILSHGSNGYVYCKDTVPGKDEGMLENAIRVEDIREKFCQVENLFEKPKLFFIQACRGDTKDKGLNIDRANLQEVHQTLMSEESDGSLIPTHSDCFISMSVTAGRASIRRTDIGTWFIQAIVYIFSHYAKDLDIQELMTLVNNLVARATTKEGCKQVSEQSHTLRKKFYFFPGLAEDNN